MIRKIKGSLTAKICILIAVLLIAASGITYAVIAGFLPAYYSSQLEKDLDAVSQEMADTISSHEKIQDAFNAIELFEAGSQASVVILDEQGQTVWPLSGAEDAEAEEGTAVELEEYTDGAVSFRYEDGLWTEEDAGSQTAEDRSGDTDESADEAVDESAVEAADEAADEVEAEEERAVVDQAISGESFGTSAGENTIWGQVAEDDFDVGAIGAVGTYTDAGEDGSFNFTVDNVVYTSQTAVKHYNLKVGDETYTMMVFGGMQPVNQAVEILYQIFPYILAVSVGVAVLFSLLASLYLTLPIVRLSRTSRKMAALDFSDQYQGRRRDEIGVLGSNLNELSANLSRTLGELQSANEKLRSDIQREREIERKRIEFFSAVSHELKTPITILKGHLNGMLQGVGEYRNRDYYLERSRETADKMEGMVQELLTVSRIENQSFGTEQLDIAEQLRQQLADMTELMEEKKIDLEADLPDHLYVQVNGTMMEKVFRNLLINAISYTPGGAGNQIRILLEKSEQDGHTFECSIENTGVFLPEESLPHLFEAFYRVEQSRNSQTGGSGLGLYIVKMVLDQHGARYVMKNTADGVKFSFLL